MAVAASDMKWFLSGGSGNTNPNASLGGIRSSTQITSNTLDNLFDDVLISEATAGDIEYRCMYLKNDHATDTLTSVVIWISANTPSANTDIAIGLDPAGITDGVSPAAAVPSPLDENNPPPGVSFVHSPDPTSQATALAIGTMAAQTCQAVWVRRTVTAGAASAAHDASTITIAGTP